MNKTTMYPTDLTINNNNGDYTKTSYYVEHDDFFKYVREYLQEERTKQKYFNHEYDTESMHTCTTESYNLTSDDEDAQQTIPLTNPPSRHPCDDLVVYQPQNRDS